MILWFLKLSISVSEYPRFLRISVVCWPKDGGGNRRVSSLLNELKLTAGPWKY
jgi:hypothetical protein